MKIYLWFILVILLVSCNQNMVTQALPTNTVPSTSSDETNVSDGTPPQSNIFSTELTESGILFIRVLDPNFVINDILISGRLTLVGNCIRIVNEDKNENATAIWSSNVKIVEDGDQIELSKVNSVDKIKIGDEIEFSATRFDRTHSKWFPLMPTECESPYYVIGNVTSMTSSP